MMIAHDKLYEGHWKDVPLVWRKLYALGALVGIACHIAAERFHEALLLCDTALLLGSPIFGDILARVAPWLHSRTRMEHDDDTEEDTDVFVPTHWTQPHIWRQDSPSAVDESIAMLVQGLTTGHDVPRDDAPSLEQFRQRYMLAQRPVIITGAMTTWSALSRWNRPRYLKVWPIACVLLDV
jgi:hypothetical protein